MSDMSATTSSKYKRALGLFEAGEYEASFEIVEQGLLESPTDLPLLLLLSRILLLAGNHEEAESVLSRLRNSSPDNAEIKYYLARALIQTRSHKSIAEARDILLEILSTPSVVPEGDVIRWAASCCSMVGPLNRSVELWKKVIGNEGTADDYYRLSDALAHLDRFPEALECLQNAARLEPGRYGKLLEEYSARNQRGVRLQSNRGRYPDTDLIQTDLKKTILDFVAADLTDVPKFIAKDTSFFTMGSCFAQHVAMSLQKKEYRADYLGIAEQVNSTYANRFLVDWLSGVLPAEGSVAMRFQELVGGRYSADEVNEKLKNCNVFVLTLGVAPCFFDRESGDFVMPRPTSLNTRALAEKYIFKTTSVVDNVNNVMYLLSYVRKLNPKVKIVVTESPVPLHMTFEFRSAVVADCLSKSTLRVAANEIVHHSGLNDIYYWPSFEIFRWLGCHLGAPVYGTDDGASWHVSEDLVDLTMECFIEKFRTV